MQPAASSLLGPQLGVFGASLHFVWGLSATLALILLPLVIHRVVQLDPMDWARAAAAFAALLLVPVLVLALTAPLLRLYRIRVHEMGLRAYNAYGRFFSVRWVSMTEAQAVSLLTLEYLRVRTTEPGVELMIPLFLSKRAEFERLVAKLAGPLNPLSRHFRESGRPGP
jgi:hypothetical protein